MNYEFSVLGPAATKGSTRSFISNQTLRVVTLHDNRRLPEWTKTVQVAARWARVLITSKPHEVRVTATWTFVAPKRDHKRSSHTVKPDLDKLARALLDALTGIAYDDDSQVTRIEMRKIYGEEERCDITIQNTHS